MSDSTARLLEVFEELPDNEKRILAQEVLRPSLPFDSGPIEDAEIAQSSDALFARLEDDENAARSR